MHARTAIVIRRAALLAAALMATFSVHLGSAGHAFVIPAAPLAWLVVLAAAIPLLAHGAPDMVAPRSPARLIGPLLAVQAVFHVAMTAAPSAFGVAGGHHVTVFATGALVGHLVVGLVLAVLLSLGERLLAGAVALARMLLRPSRRCRSCVAVGPLEPWHPAMTGRHRTAPRSSRGPPRMDLLAEAPSAAAST